ncbi:MAG: response regulator [Magnetovibrionaceae bacterium]
MTQGTDNLAYLAAMNAELSPLISELRRRINACADMVSDPTQKDLLDGAREATGLLTALTHEVQDLHCLMTGELTLEPQPVQLSNLLEAVDTLLSRFLKQKACRLDIRPPADSASVWFEADQGRLGQVLLSLARNLSHGTENARLSLSVDVDDSEARITFTLTLKQEAAEADPGLPFLFARENAERLLAMMGGGLEEASFDRNERRTRFFVPLIRLSPPQPDLIPEPSAEHDPLPPARVLIVEDNAINRIVIEGIIARWGCLSESVVNGREGVEAVQARDFDLVLMDIQMPEMDGIQATRAIRKLSPEKAAIPIVAITALAMKGDRERLLAAGMDAFVPKPIDRDFLLATLNNLLGRDLQAAASPDVEPTDNRPDDDDEAQDASEPGLVDVAILKKLGDDTDPDMLPELVALYVEETRKRIEEVERALSAGDDSVIEREVHTLGSSSGAHGLTQLLQAARAVETSYRLDDAETARMLAEGLPDLADRSLGQLLEIDIPGLWT